MNECVKRGVINANDSTASETVLILRIDCDGKDAGKFDIKYCDRNAEPATEKKIVFGPIRSMRKPT